MNSLDSLDHHRLSFPFVGIFFLQSAPTPELTNADGLDILTLSIQNTVIEYPN